jgi:hypothetical protein
MFEQMLIIPTNTIISFLKHEIIVDSLLVFEFASHHLLHWVNKKNIFRTALPNLTYSRTMLFVYSKALIKCN